MTKYSVIGLFCHYYFKSSSVVAQILHFPQFFLSFSLGFFLDLCLDHHLGQGPIGEHFVLGFGVQSPIKNLSSLSHKVSLQFGSYNLSRYAFEYEGLVVLQNLFDLGVPLRHIFALFLFLHSLGCFEFFFLGIDDGLGNTGDVEVIVLWLLIAIRAFGHRLKGRLC